jgi:thioredoxin-dependent peroxiredoxin
MIASTLKARRITLAANKTINLVMAALFVIASGFLSAAQAADPTLGSPAPAFKLQDQDGNWHSLNEYSGKWLTLYFYPKDQTPGCTTEACEFRDNIFAFKDLNAVIVGISIDTVESHKKFEAKHTLPFTLLADPSKETAKTYGVLKKFMGVLEMADRQTFLIDPNGHIAKIYRDVDPKKHSAEVLADIKVLQKKPGG